MSKTLAVVTGDIIDSSGLDKKSRKNLPAFLRKSFKNTAKYFPGAFEGELEVFGGDGWQFAINNVSRSLRIALAYRLLLKSGLAGLHADTRLSIAIGTADFISKNKISESDGDAFRLSGRGLESLSKNSFMSFNRPNFSLVEEFTVFFVMLDSIVTRYTDKQSLAVFGKLTELKQEQITALWPLQVKQQTISGHLNNAQWNAVEKFMRYYENRLQSL